VTVLPRAEWKARAGRVIDEHRQDILAIAAHLLKTPETGYRERRSARFVAEQFAKLQLPYRDGLALTGVKAWAGTGAPGPTVAVIGELDSALIQGHPHADPQTGAAQGCGHHAQIAAMFGVAKGLCQSGVMENLGGRVVFFAVPAEELIELEFRDELRRAGKIEFIDGKAELIRLGEFDDIDMAMLTHTTSEPQHRKLALFRTNNASVVKHVQYLGRSPLANERHKGINALTAAVTGYQAVMGLRESFREADAPVVTAIITNGGHDYGVTPADVRLQVGVRARTVDGLRDLERRVDRALQAGASAVGAGVRITTFPGYLPMTHSPGFHAVYTENAIEAVGEADVVHEGHRVSHNDMGDLSHLMPVIHPYVGGASGINHGPDYVVEDYELAVITAAKVMAMTVIDLLAENARRAREVIASTPALLSKSGYLELVRNLAHQEMSAPRAAGSEP
jgi:amidohydrolase